MADLDDLHAVMLEVRDLVKQQLEHERENAERARAQTELALRRQATAVRFQRIGIVVVLLMVALLAWYLYGHLYA